MKRTFTLMAATFSICVSSMLVWADQNRQVATADCADHHRNVLTVTYTNGDESYWYAGQDMSY